MNGSWRDERVALGGAGKVEPSTLVGRYSCFPSDVAAAAAAADEGTLTLSRSRGADAGDAVPKSLRRACKNIVLYILYVNGKAVNLYDGPAHQFGDKIIYPAPAPKAHHPGAARLHRERMHARIVAGE